MDTVSDWNLFWNQLKNEKLQTDNFSWQIKYFIFCEYYFFLMPQVG